MSGLPGLAEATWLVQPETQRVLTALTAAGFSARAVGGCVRNGLLGLPVTDIDIATTALPSETQAVVQAAGMAAVPTGIEHGTITVIANHVPFEVTTLRKDVATDGRRAVVAFTKDWAEDAARRDFTMNVLYCGAEGTVYDPLGFYGDVLAGKVRFIGDPQVRIHEDYLRILRFFRFHATFGAGALDAEGALACVRARDGLRKLSAERVGGEMLKLLVAPRAVAGIEAMFDLGLLADVIGGVPCLARLARLAAIEQSLPFKPGAALRLAALGVHTEEDAARLGGRLRLSSEQQAVLNLAASRDWRLSAVSSPQQARVTLYHLGHTAMRQRILLDWAAAGDPPDNARWRRLWTLAAQYPVPRLPIAGRDLLALGLAAGPKVGELLRRLEKHWIESDFTADAEALKAEALRHL